MEPDSDTFGPDTRDSLTIRAYVRPSLLFDPVDGKIARLQALEAAGGVNEVTVEAWPETVPLGSEPTFPEVIETFERFDEWAKAAGASIRPPFTVRTTTSEFTGETKRLLHTPVICLALDVNGRLASVVPRSEGDTNRSVTDALAALGTGEVDGGGGSPAAVAEQPEQCPEVDAGPSSVL